MRQLVLPTFEHYVLREISVSGGQPFPEGAGEDQELRTAKQGEAVLSLGLWAGGQARRAQENCAQRRRMPGYPSSAP